MWIDIGVVVVMHKTWIAQGFFFFFIIIINKSSFAPPCRSFTTINAFMKISRIISSNGRECLPIPWNASCIIECTSIPTSNFSSSFGLGGLWRSCSTPHWTSLCHTTGSILYMWVLYQFGWGVLNFSQWTLNTFLTLGEWTMNGFSSCTIIPFLLPF